ncbi:hypothetical protein EJB05_27664 [Eragrostis curvula]|uniref:Uncharacterized protein n=1 Tax=Eragrostis curvula TaxID=38414 RepID=A0A5J9UMX7_9POAL|nr:hypothetical protein EJB05_27664 [Eragrostis curvula]
MFSLSLASLRSGAQVPPLPSRAASVELPPWQQRGSTWIEAGRHPPLPWRAARVPAVRIEAGWHGSRRDNVDRVRSAWIRRLHLHQHASPHQQATVVVNTFGAPQRDAPPVHLSNSYSVRHSNRLRPRAAHA